MILGLYLLDAVRSAALLSLTALLGISLYIVLDARHYSEINELFRMSSYIMFLAISIGLIYGQIGDHHTHWFEPLLLFASMLAVPGQVTAARDRRIHRDATRETRK